jgi:chemotaxis protein MotB
MGPGGASTSPINLGGGSTRRRARCRRPTDRRHGHERAGQADRSQDRGQKAAEAEELKKLLEKKQLDALMQDLKEAINKSQALQPSRTSCCSTSRPKGCASRSSMRRTARCSTRQRAAEAVHREDPARGHRLPEDRAEPHQRHGHTDTTPYAGITGSRTGTCPRSGQRGAPRHGRVRRLPTADLARRGLASSVLFDRRTRAAR